VKSITVATHLRISLIMLLASFAIVLFPFLIEISSDFRLYPKSIKNNVFSFNLEKLPKGNFFLAIGKVRAICSLKVDGKDIRTLDAPTGVMPEASIDIPFKLHGTENEMLLNCSEEMKGFPARLTHTPVIMSYTDGKLLSATRYVLDVLLGSFATALLFVMVTYLSLSSGNFMPALLGLGLSALFYSLNQTYFFRTIFSGDLNSILHPASKCIFCWLLYRTVAESKRFGLLDLFILVAPLGSLAFFQQNEVDLRLAYKICHFFWLACFLNLYRCSFSKDISELSKSLILLWSLALLADSTSLITAFGPFFSPVFFAILVGGLTAEAGRIARRTALLHRNAQEIGLISTNLTLTPTESINSLADALMYRTDFAGYSVYLDSSLVGTSNRAGERFSKIGHAGKVCADAPTTLEVCDGEATLIRQAIANKEAITQNGIRTGGWFSVIPIGEHAVICLTTDKTKKKPDLSYFISMLEIIAPSLRAIESRLLELSTILNSSLARLKKDYKNGSYDLHSGAIFIDIAEYSKNCESFGTSYAEFISSVYFPSMIRYMESWATPEVVRGDEIYFVIANELTKKNVDIIPLTALAIQRIHSFVNDDGYRIAKEQGYPKVEYRIGATIGNGNLVVDDVQVRTSGEHINRAKRLQESASKNEVLVDQALIQGSNDVLISLSQKSVVVKKNLIEAVRVGIRKAA
jgi:hypothetical protein